MATNEITQPPTQRLKVARDRLRTESASLSLDSYAYQVAHPDAAKVLEYAAKKIFRLANSMERLTRTVWDE